MREKKKEITTIKKVWTSDPDYHQILRTLTVNFLKNSNHLTSYTHSPKCFMRGHELAARESTGFSVVLHLNPLQFSVSGCGIIPYRSKVSYHSRLVNCATRIA